MVHDTKSAQQAQSYNWSSIVVHRHKAIVVMRLRWIVFMASLYMYYTLSFVLFEHSVCHEPIFVLINVFTLLT